MILKQLRDIDIFSNLNDDLLAEISKFSILKKLEKGSILFYEGETPKYVYVLLKGQLKLYKSGVKSKEVVLHHFIKPSLIAEMTVLEDISFPATSMAMSDDTQVALIDKEKFLKLLHENSEFAFMLIRSLSKKIKQLESMINRNLVFDATLRICSLLKDDPSIFKSLKSKEIASILNITPETLSRVLGKLRKLDVLDKDNQLKSIEKLEMYVDF
jgi:CRP/FNR family transcriptional regulator